MKEAEEHTAAMTHANSTLRESSTTNSIQMKRLTEALRIAGQNAANAKADAEAAEHKTSSLTRQISLIKGTFEDTKRTCESLRCEHDDISSASRVLEGRLLQSESKLRRVEKDAKTKGEERNYMQHEMEQLDQERRKLQSTLAERESDLGKTKKIIIEKEDMEKARIQRTTRLENELRESKSILVDVTSSAAELEANASMLQGTIKELQSENKTLHETIQTTIETSRIEKDRLHKSLVTSESDAQRLRITCGAHEEELNKLRLDKISTDKEILQLKNRLVSLEKRSTETSPDNDSQGRIKRLSDPPVPSLGISKRSLNHLPVSSNDSSTLGASRRSDPKADVPVPNGLNKENNSNSGNTNNVVGRSRRRRKSIGGGAPLSSMKCCICFKNAYGIMKSCQCGDISCKKKAHASCVASKTPLHSVSHPGTPAPVLPCILCKNTTFQKSNVGGVSKRCM